MITFSSLRKLFSYPELIGILIAFAGVTIYALSENLTYTPDSSRYVIWANSLANGDGFTDRTAPEPARYVIHAPLYSIVLSPVAALFPNNIIALKCATIALALMLLITLFILVLNTAGRKAAFISTVLFASNPLLVHYATQVLSEVLFGLFLLLLFLLLHRWEISAPQSKRDLVLLSLTVLGCIFSREIGIVTAAVVFGYFLYHERYENAAWIFIAVCAGVGAWYIRNELIVAAREHPDMRNVLLFGANILTSKDQSVFNELAARFAVNIQFYLQHLPHLLFAPQLSPSGTIDRAFYPIIDRMSWLIHLAQTIVSPAFIAVGFCSLGLVGYGLYKEFRYGSMGGIYTVFVVLYVGMLMLYPVTDIRFTFPLIVIMVILFARGIVSLTEYGPRWILQSAVVLIILCIVPNMLWNMSYALEAHRYNHDPIAFIEAYKKNPARGAEYLTPYAEAAEWLEARNDSSMVVLSDMKDLSLHLRTKKMFLLGVYVPMSLFEQTLRDYDIQYIVTRNDNTGWHDFEFQMNLTKEYSFYHLHSAGTLDIFAVKKVTAQSPKVLQLAHGYQYMFYYLEQGGYDTLRSFFRQNAHIVDARKHLRFFEGVAMEGSGYLDSAETIYDELYGIQQSFVLTQRIGHHKSVIQKRRLAERTEKPQERAAITMDIALNYWELDLRKNAFRFLDATIKDDTAYLPAYNLYFYFSLLNRDTLQAASVWNAMKKRFPDEPVVPLFTSLIYRLDTLRKGVDHDQRSALNLRIADDYKELGLTESQLDALQTAYRLDPSNIALALELSSILEAKSKYYPALKILETTLKHHPSSIPLAERRSAILARY